MKRARFTSKMIIYNLLLFFSIILLVTGVFYYWVVRDIQSRAQIDFETLSGKTAGQFDTLVYNIDKTALQIAANPTIVARFTSLTKNPSANYFIENPLVASEVIRLLNSYNFKKDGNTRICLYNNDHDFVYSATTMTTADGVANFFASDDFKKVNTHFADNNVFSMFRAPGPDILNTSGLPSPNYFSIVRQIKDYYSGTQENGYVEVQQSVARIDKIFSDLGEESYAAVYNQKGALIYLCPALRENAEVLEKFKKLNPASLPLGVIRHDQDFYGRYQTEEAPLDIIFFKSGSTILTPIVSFSLFLVVALLLAMLVAIFSEQVLVKRLSKPLVELNRSIKNVNIDNLKLELANTQDSDELQQLDAAFNKMLAHLHHAIERQLLSQTNELKAHLFALQSQMNPHFIHNILAIINMEAEIDGNEKTVTICKALSRMLSYSSSMGDGFAKAGDELSHTENYLELMKQRYEDGFEYNMQVDESLCNVFIPKLIVQPLCENCFKHAFMNSEEVWRIRVDAVQCDSMWVIAVEDNGTGVTPEFLAEFDQFKNGLTLDSMRDRIQQCTIGGLSLPNIYMRLKLCYGDRFICEIRNTNHGSVVTLGGNIDDTHADSRG
ncbi:sensor histidine kinase [Pygmaiobacter massiliensis]|uniref:sensor histidine kinase n=1 Tax=Pygmaiobacter massiliensis TaxID=1917873 RepID=UPI000C7B4597|nr:histidine kinase [Pygmaiobacter massiliensis]